MKKKWYASTQFSDILLKTPLSSKLLMSDLLWCNFHRYICINSHAFSGMNIYYQIRIIFFYIYMLFFAKIFPYICPKIAFSIISGKVKVRKNLADFHPLWISCSRSQLSVHMSSCWKRLIIIILYCTMYMSQ